METPEALRALAGKYRGLADAGDRAEREWRLNLATALEWRAHVIEWEQAFPKAPEPAAAETHPGGEKGAPRTRSGLQGLRVLAQRRGRKTITRTK